MTTSPRRPVTVRRNDVQRHITMNRGAIAAAWADVELAATRTEVNLRRAAVWAKRASGLAAIYATWRALRRMPHGGLARKAMELVVASKALGRVMRAMSRAG